MISGINRLIQPSSCKIAEVALVILGIAILSFGIWQLYQPFLSNYSAAAWGFITLGALLTSTAIVWRIVANFKQRIQSSESKLKTSNVPAKIEIYGREIALDIFKSVLLPCLDNKTLMNLKSVNSSFYHAVSDYIESNEALKSTIYSQKFIFALKNRHPLSFFSRIATKLNTSTIEGHTRSVNSVYYRDGMLFSGSWDKKVKIWQREKGKWKCIESLEHKGGVNSVYYRDGMLFIGLENKEIKIWQNDNGEWKCIATLNEHNDAVNSVYYRDGILFSGSSDEKVKVWQNENGIWKCIDTLNKHEREVSCVYYRDGMLFSGSWDDKVKVWQREKGKWKCTQARCRHRGVTSVYYKEGMLFSGSYSKKTIKVWKDISSQFPDSVTLKGHKHGISCLYYKYGMLFSGSFDKTVKIWKKENLEWKCIATLKNHNGCVTSLSYGDGMLFSGSADKKIKVYHIQT